MPSGLLRRGAALVYDAVAVPTNHDTDPSTDRVSAEARFSAVTSSGPNWALESGRTMANLRVALVVCISMSLLALMPSVARAGEAPCRQRLLHDWYKDGQVEGQYRVICYRAALADLPDDDIIYGTTRRDLSRALSSGIDRVKQEGVTVGPQTLLPAPQTLLATPVTKSRSVLSLPALAFLLVLLLVWCVARWRSSRLD